MIYKLMGTVLGISTCFATNPPTPQQARQIIRYTRAQLLAIRNTQTPPPALQPTITEK